MNICIIGLGLIGGSIALDVKNRLNGSARITGVEANESHRAEALRLSLVDELVSFDAGIAAADLVVVAVPVDAALKMLPNILDRLKAEGVVTDVGSTKERLARAVRDHARSGRYVGSHPMAGTENSGPQAASRGLFDQKTAVICDREHCDADALARVEELYNHLGMRLISMSAAEHDVHAAYVSHLSHITSFVLANTVLKQEQNGRTIFDLAGGGFESTVRLAKSSPDMWAPIFAQNSAHVLEALDAYQLQLRRFRDELVGGNVKALHTLMREANEIRPVLANIKSHGKPS